MKTTLATLAVTVLASLSAFGCAFPGSEPEQEEVATSEASLSETGPVLTWGTGVRGEGYDRSVNELLGRCDDFIDALSRIPVPQRFVDEGRPSDDPAKTKSRAIWLALETNMPAVGYCARIANPKQEAASQAIIRWGDKLMTTYHGGFNLVVDSDDDDPGNPINERHLIPVMFGWDMAYGRMTDAEKTKVRSFLDALDTRVTDFMNALPRTDERRQQNWMTDALAIRSYGALVSRRELRAKALASRFSAFVLDTYTPDTGWRRSTCENLAKVNGYGSFDLQQRDSLAIHMKGLETVLQLSALRPSFFDDTAQAATRDALEMTKPYVSGSEVHKELLCSTVASDKDHPAYGTSWDPRSAKDAFRFARLAHASTRRWLGAFDTEDHALWIKVLASGRGDNVVYR
ncbi:MAG: hypothetical protein U0270_16590 [Labilithrix sp.]